MDRERIEQMFWDLLSKVYFQIFYCETYLHRLQKINLTINVIAYLLLGIPIILLGFLPNYIVLWAVIIAFSQFLQLLKPLLPLSEREIALRYFLPSIKELAIELDFQWLRLPILSDDDLLHILKVNKKRYATIEERFIGSTTIPKNRGIDQEALNALHTELNTLYSNHDEGCNA
jgi:hypothetical protein